MSVVAPNVKTTAPLTAVLSMWPSGRVRVGRGFPWEDELFSVATAVEGR